MMLQKENPDDYVIGTGQSHSVREFTEKALEYAGIRLEWTGKGVKEIEFDYRWHGKPPTPAEAKQFLDELRTLKGKIQSEHQ